jgi:hypothetical protein
VGLWLDDGCDHAPSETGTEDALCSPARRLMIAEPMSCPLLGILGEDRLATIDFGEDDGGHRLSDFNILL